MNADNYSISVTVRLRLASTAVEHIQRRIRDALIPCATSEITGEGMAYFVLADRRAVAVAL